MKRLIQLFHLTDSAFPIGGYAYSYGMEYAVKSGIIQNLPDMRQYLLAFYQQMVSFDLSFVQAAYCAEQGCLSIISEQYEAMLLNNKVKMAGEILGANWKRLLQSLYPVETALLQEVKVKDFPLLFGFSCKLMSIGQKEMADMFLFMGIRDQVSAIIRLGSLGPTQANILQVELMSVMEKDFDIDKVPSIDQAWKSAYLLELSQLSHKNLYTKLFQN